MAERGGIVIVGAGECGAHGALKLRELGYRGEIVLVGNESQLPYERPPLSKAALLSSDPPAPVVVLGRDLANESRIELVQGQRVTAIDRQNRTVSLSASTPLAYDQLLLATGARPRPLPVDGGEHALLLRTHDDAIAIRERIKPGEHAVIVGAGFIGLEVAAAVRRAGCAVSVLESGSRPLQRGVPEPLAEVLHKRHLDEGVDIRCDVQIHRIALEAPDRFRVELGSGAESIEADLVVAGVGVLPNVELAASAGLQVDNGIAVDSQLRTSDPAIFAAGDCCAATNQLFDGRRIRLESWRNAYDQAAVAASNMMGQPQTFEAVPWFWSDQYDLGLQVAGLPHLAASEVTRDGENGLSVRFGLAADGRLVSASGVSNGTAIAKHIRIGEMMIAARLSPNPADLADPAKPLKKLFRDAQAEANQ